MEKLPKGITGFWKIGKRPPPSTDKSIIILLEKMQNTGLFKTVTVSKPGADNNFFIISLFSNNQKHVIGINSSYPLYCGIKSLSDWTTVEFYDLPNLLTDILNKDFTELKCAFLNTKLKKNHLSLLDKVELEQIEYWKTEKIGNVIFNKYD